MTNDLGKKYRRPGWGWGGVTAVYLGFFGSEHFVKILGGDRGEATEMAVARVTTLNDL